MSDNNDPIKDYNPLSLKLDRLQEKMEMNFEEDDPITDLHDCSNDLSDKGSRKEEYEHSKFAEKYKNRVYGSEKVNFDQWKNTKKNLNISWIFILIIFIIVINIVSAFFQLIGEIIETLGEAFESGAEYYYDDSSSDYYNDSYTQDEEIEFENYVKKISIDNYKTEDGETYICTYNMNSESYIYPQIESTFYDENGKILNRTTTYVNILLGGNKQYIEISDAPFEYATSEHKITAAYGYYRDINKEDIYIDSETMQDDFYEKKVTIINNNEETIDCLTYSMVYLKDDVIVDIEDYYFFDLETGVAQSKEITLNELNENDFSVMFPVINDINIY